MALTSSRVMKMDQSKPLSVQFQDWLASPTVTRAYGRLQADVEAVVARVKPMLQGVWDQIGPMIDPPAQESPPGPPAKPGASSEEAATSQ
jgi:hypothetical protein